MQKVHEIAQEIKGHWCYLLISSRNPQDAYIETLID